MTFPDRARVAIAVADVHRPGRTGDAVVHDVDGLDRQTNFFWIAGQKGLVYLQHRGAGLGQCLCLAVQHPRERQHEVVDVPVSLVVHAPGERKRAGERELDRAIGVVEREAQVVDQAERGALVVDRDGVTDIGVVVVVVEGLGDVRDLDAGHAHQKIIDVVVAAKLAV